MKVILKENIKKIGKKGEIREVPNGYALNFLIPNKFAVMATNSELKKLENSESIKSKNTENKKADEEIKFNLINDKKFEIKSNSNKEGVLFAAIDVKKIAKIAKLNPEEIILDENIKKLGNYEIKIKIGENEGMILIQIT